MAEQKQLKNPDILQPIRIDANPINDSDIKFFTEISENTSIPELVYPSGEKSNGAYQDVIEFHLYDDIGTLIYSNYFLNDLVASNDLNTLIPAKLQLKVIQDLRAAGVRSGSYKIRYKFFRRLFGKSIGKNDTEFSTENFTDYFYIDEISNSRYEIRVLLKGENFDERIKSFVQDDFYAGQSGYFPTYIFDSSGKQYKIELVGNIGQDRELNIINWIRDDVTYGSTRPSIIFKLREELPGDINVQNILFLDFRIVEDYETSIDLIAQDSSPDVVTILRPANTDIKIDTVSKFDSGYKSWDNLTTTDSNVSRQILSTVMSGNMYGVDLNVDFKSFPNFIFFGSAYDRLENFKYKLKLIEEYDTAISTLTTPVSASVTGSYNYTASLNSYYDKKYQLIGTFDQYEKYLYYESSSYESSSYGEFYPTTWPKTTSTKPYTLATVESIQAVEWYDGIIVSASYYDRENIYSLQKSLPEFIYSNDSNVDYKKFISMVGHYYDNIWLYITKFLWFKDQDESIDVGITKDLITNAIKSLGFDVSNDLTLDDLWRYALGTDSAGSYSTNDNVEAGQTYVTSSIAGLTNKEISLEIWKRLLNNLPYIYKTNGTLLGIQSVLSCFGIPETVLSVETYGQTSELDKLMFGVMEEINSLGLTSITDKFNYAYERLKDYLENNSDSQYVDYNSKFGSYISETIMNKLFAKDSADRFVQRFYKLNFSGAQRIDVPYTNLSSLPKTIEFDFQISDDNVGDYTLLYRRPTNNIILGTEYLEANDGSLKLYHNQHPASGSTTILSIPTASIYDGNWWSVMLINSASQWNMFLKRAQENEIAFEYSSSVTYASGTQFYSDWNTTGSLAISSTSSITISGVGSQSFAPFVGSIREFRYWRTALREDVFNQHVLNPLSNVGNTFTASYSDLGFRLPLGTDLIAYNHSTSSQVSSSHTNQNKTTFGDGQLLMGTFVGFDNEVNYTAYDYTCHVVSPLLPTDRAQSVQDSINIVTQPRNNVVFKNTTSNRNWEERERKSKIALTFSPSKKVIDRDIINQFGNFSIFDYIANPEDFYRNNYKDLSILRNEYFKKYTGAYGLNDYIRLSEFFNRGLFSVIKKMKPIKSTMLTGMTIESDVLHRNKITQLKELPKLSDQQLHGIGSDDSGSNKPIEIKYDDVIDFSADFPVFQTLENETYQDNIIDINSDYNSYEQSNDLYVLDDTNLMSDYNSYETAVDQTKIIQVQSEVPSFTINACTSRTEGTFNGETTPEDFSIGSIYNPCQLIWSGSAFFRTKDDITRINSLYRAEMPNISGSTNNCRYKIYELIPSASTYTRLYHNAEYRGLESCALEKLYYRGCKVTSPDFNKPSPDTPDGGPAVEIAITNTKDLRSGRPLGGNSDLKIS